MALGNLKSSGHLSRWAVAIVLLPPVLWLIMWDYPIPFFFLVLVLGGLVWWEFATNLFGRDRTGLMGLGLLGWAAVAAGTQFLGPTGQQMGLGLALALGGLYAMGQLSKATGPVILNLMSRYALGHLYLSFLLSFLLLLRQLNNGSQWIIYALVVTMLADVAAFYVGTRFKGPKLYPPASPNKTISGLVGGVVTAMVASAISATYLPSGASWFVLMLLGGFLGLWGALGDLFESTLKRALEIKDTSGLLMGHGGFWDRLDALMFNILPIYIFANLWVGP